MHEINKQVVSCTLCPRLCAWTSQVATEKRRAFLNEIYWGKPVPSFGDPNATRLIVGLAPAAHGANRTGRMFTGDRSGDWLFRALHKAGIANQPNSDHSADGLELKGVLITAVAHCAPPDNKPTLEEISNCSRYLRDVLSNRHWVSILCLGSIAWKETLKTLKSIGSPALNRPFSHNSESETQSGTKIIGCYHPSQQNTFTGQLTEPMFDDAIERWLK